MVGPSFDFNLALVTLTFKFLPRLYLRTVMCRKLILGILVRGCWYARSCCGLDLTFDPAVVTLTFKILSELYIRTVTCRKLILGRDIGRIL